MDLPSGLGSDERAQSAPLGMALIFAIMIASTTAVVAIGANSISTTQSQIDLQRAEKTMTQLDSKAAVVALGESKVQSVDVSSISAENYEVDENTGHVTVVHQEGGTTTTLVDTDLGELRYNQSGTTLAYQGGGVWRLTDNGSTMVSPPEFHYRNATLTFPVITVKGDRSISGRASLTRTSSSQVDVANPIQDGKIVVTITSDYYQAWGQFFKDRTDGAVTYDHANDKVTVELVTPIGQTQVSSAVAGLSSGTLHIAGNGGEPGPCASPPGSPDKFYTDSYDSSLASDYCTQWLSGTTNKDGNVTFGGDIEFTGNAKVYGNLKSGGQIEIPSGSAEVEGNVYYTDPPAPSGDYNNAIQISGVGTQAPINSVVASEAKEIANNPDNDDANDDATEDPIVSNQLNFGGDSDATINNAGQYHLEKIDLGSGETLILDTSSGDISIAVDKYVDVGDGEIQVLGNNEVKIYIRTMGTNPSDGKVSTGWRPSGLRISNGEVSIPGNDATQLTVYGNDTLNVSMIGSGGDPAVFNGVIYAPVGSDGPGGLEIKHGDIFGGVVSGDVFIRNKGRIHYDENLEGQQMVSKSVSVAKVTYVHVSTNTVSITDG